MSPRSTWQHALNLSFKHNSAQHDATALIDLDQLGIIAVSGPDAETFLQGQLTCDLRRLNEHTSLPGSLNTSKGRTICTLLVVRAQDAVYLLLQKNVLADVMQVLKKYIIFSKASLSDQSEALCCFSLQGEQAPALIQSVFATSQEPYHTASVDDLHCITLPGPRPRFLLLGKPETAEKQLQHWAKTCVLAGPQLWQRSQIEAGLPEVGAKTREQFLPHNLNLHLTGGISFEKGCYTGQEVIARMHYRSTPKTALFIGTIHLPDHTQRAEDVEGAQIYESQNGQQRALGEIVNAVAEAPQKLRALMLLPKDFPLDTLSTASFILEHQTVQLGPLQRPPYAITNTE